MRSKSKTFPSQLNESEDIKKQVNKMIEEFLIENDVYVRRVGITISKLEEETSQRKLSDW